MISDIGEGEEAGSSPPFVARSSFSDDLFSQLSQLAAKSGPFEPRPLGSSFPAPTHLHLRSDDLRAVGILSPDQTVDLSRFTSVLGAIQQRLHEDKRPVRVVAIQPGRMGGFIIKLTNSSEGQPLIQLREDAVSERKSDIVPGAAGPKLRRPRAQRRPSRKW